MSTHNMFSWRNEQNIMWILPLIWSYGDGYINTVFWCLCSNSSISVICHKPMTYLEAEAIDLVARPIRKEAIDIVARHIRREGIETATRNFK